MTFQHMKFEQGQQVIVVDSRGEYEFRGMIVGRSNSMRGHSYDVMPLGAKGGSHRLPGLSESRIRAVAKPILAYERRSSEPQHILDEA